MRIFFAFTFFMTVFSSALVNAQEAACTALGANCVCSEPLQATVYNLYGASGGFAWDPNDSTVLQCNGGWGNGYAVTNLNLTSNSTVASDPTVLAKLPVGNTVARYLKMNDGWTGQMFIGHDYAFAANPSQFLVRNAIRWYQYYSTDAGFDDDPGYQSLPGPNNSCGGNKLLELGIPGQDIIGDDGFGEVNLYPFTVFDLAGGSGCCFAGELNRNMPANVLAHATGPQTIGQVPYYSYQRGHWLRWELVIVNRDSHASPMELHLYVQNISVANDPEYEVFDSCIASASNTAPCTQRASQVLHSIAINGFRQNNGGVGCPGSRAYMYLMVAGWDTNANQRIGVATEVESGGGGPPPPPSSDSPYIFFQSGPPERPMTVPNAF